MITISLITATTIVYPKEYAGIITVTFLTVFWTVTIGELLDVGTVSRILNAISRRYKSLPDNGEKANAS